MKIVKIFLAFLVAVSAQTALFSVVEPQVALAKPPSWAPAHGYRRKHKDNDDRDSYREPLEGTRYYVLFERLDSNRDGVISIQEWHEGDDLFRRLDLNHDGVLSRYELSRIDLERGLVSRFFDKVKEKISTFWSWLW